ncbi:MAG: DUF3810 domain-containing protein [Bacteroidetes bacterium]|nr:DUF3810 domain-containing protein [Bacteroidota bacterium]
MVLRQYRKWFLLIGIAVFIKIFSLFPLAVEKYYSTGIYPVIARILRIFFGWIPFSIGDIFYTVIGIYLLVQIVYFFKKLIRKQIDRSYISRLLKRILACCLWIYIVFNVAWGLNYDRMGIDYQLQLQLKPYDKFELRDVVQLIVKHLNDLDSTSHIARRELYKKNTLFDNAIMSYENISKENKFLVYQSPSVKPSVFSYMGNYLGFSGYYNPFSGEAQVNTTVPVYVRPFTTCHEIGHQLGYAKENEANFAGYLSAKSSNNTAFQYSVYFDLYLYAASELYYRDSTLMVPLREQLKPTVRHDLRMLREFFNKYQNPFEPYIRKIYGRYLKANNQPKGIMTYDEVTGRIIAYYRKYKEI